MEVSQDIENLNLMRYEFELKLLIEVIITLPP